MLSQSWQHALHSLEGWQMGMLRQQLQRPPVPCNMTGTVIDRPSGTVLGSHDTKYDRVDPMRSSLASCHLLDDPISSILKSNCIAHTLCSPASVQRSASCCRSSSDTATAPC